MSKRGNGDGTAITRHSSGQWWTRVTPPGGKRMAFYGKTQREVREKRDAYLAAWRDGRITKDSEKMVSDYLTGWLKGRRDGLGVRTAEAYDLNIRRLSPHLGHIKLGDLKPAQIRECYARLLERGLSGRPLSKRAVAQAHAVLHTALHQAVKDETLLRNPCDAVSPPRGDHKEMSVLSLEQVQTLFQHTEADRLHALWVLLCLTGMRIGEALALRWTDVDMTARTVTIQRSLRRVKGEGLQFGPVKTHRSNRRLDLPALVVDALRLQEDRQRMERRNWPENAGEGLIFTTTSGGRLDAGNILESLRRRFKGADLPALRTHDLRHTAASIHLRDNQHPKVVQELLGHSTFTLTMNTYSHLMPSMTRDAADRMDALFHRSEAAT